MHVFRLTDFEGEENEDFVRGKNEIKDHKLEKTKGITVTLVHIMLYLSFRIYPPMKEHTKTITKFTNDKCVQEI